jgi:hypothetical protein
MQEALPVYRMDLSLTFPEILSVSQTTADADRPIGAYALTLAYLLSGKKFDGQLATLTMEQVYEELKKASWRLDIPIERLFAFARSLLLPPEATLSEGDMQRSVPYRMVGKGFKLHNYQRNVAAWAANRLGTVLALGCGVGKTATATAAAMSAGILGRCSRDRCIISCPVNAMDEWIDYKEDLAQVFHEVHIISVDSTHHLNALSARPGGALIEDEVHKNKNAGKKRTEWNHDLRRKFEWCTALTGSLLHTGCEGVMSILDLALPGLSRYFNKWDFGAAFDAVIMKDVPALHTKKRTLGFPNDHNTEAFARYLARGVRSLSYESEEVGEELQIPGQTKTTEDLWEIPDWVQHLREEWLYEQKAKLADIGKLSDEELLKNCPYMWGPETDWTQYAGAMAVALMNEHEDILREILMEDYGIETDTPEQQLDVVKDLIRQSPEDKHRKKLRAFCGLPSFSKLFWELRVDGNIDRIVALVDQPTEENPNQKTFRFIYAPGSDRHMPEPGAKIRRFEEWCQKNPDEQVVAGAASSLSVEMMMRVFDRNGWSYGVIDGEVPSTHRGKLKRAFQRGAIRGMLVQQVAGSESITLTKAANSFLIDHDLQPTAYTQYLARTCRQGQKRECEHFDYAFNDTQKDRIRALRRGERFDAETRKLLEASIIYPNLKG